MKIDGTDYILDRLNETGELHLRLDSAERQEVFIGRREVIPLALALLRESGAGIHEQAEIIGSYDNEMVIRDRWGAAINIGREDWTRIALGMLKEAEAEILPVEEDGSLYFLAEGQTAMECAEFWDKLTTNNTVIIIQGEKGEK